MEYNKHIVRRGIPVLMLVLLSLLGCHSEDQREVRNRGSETANWWDALPHPQWQAFERVDDGQGWFEIYRVRPHIYALYEAGQFEEVISFLILGEERALLFDTGLGIGDIRAQVTALTDLEIVVLNSHSHYDHVGGNYQFETVWGRDTPFTRDRMRGLDHAAVAEAVSEGWIWKPLPAGFKRGDYVSRPWNIERVIDEGSQIDLGGVSLEVLFTPGHAPDCISLLDRHRRLLFTGDTFYLAPLYAHLDGSNLEDYLASSAKLAALAEDVDTLVTSHNIPTASAGYLQALHAALESIVSGSRDYRPVDGGREYDFDGFSVLTPDPPR